MRFIAFHGGREITNATMVTSGDRIDWVGWAGFRRFEDADSNNQARVTIGGFEDHEIHVWAKRRVSLTCQSNHFVAIL